jgi:hypothetical protein
VEIKYTDNAFLHIKALRADQLDELLTLSRESLGPIGPNVFKGSKHKSAKNLQKILTLGFYLRLFYNITKLHIWPSLTAISF